MAEVWCDIFWNKLNTELQAKNFLVIERSINIWRRYLESKIQNYVVIMSEDGICGGFTLSDNPSFIFKAVDTVLLSRDDINAELTDYIEDLFQPFFNNEHTRVDDCFRADHRHITPRRARRFRQLLQELHQNRIHLHNIHHHIDRLHGQFVNGLVDEVFHRTAWLTTPGATDINLNINLVEPSI